MNTAILAAEIARRVPEMKRDSCLNNAQVIQRLIEAELRRSRPEPPLMVVEFNDGLKFADPPGTHGRPAFDPPKPTWKQFWKAAETARRIKLGADAYSYPRDGWDRSTGAGAILRRCSLEVCRRRPLLHKLCLWAGYY